MPIDEIESRWRETGITCECGGMMYSDGKNRPQCSDCLKLATDEQIYTRLISDDPRG